MTPALFIGVWLALMFANMCVAAWRRTTKGHDVVAIWLMVYLLVVVIGSAIKEAMT